MTNRIILANNGVKVKVCNFLYTLNAKTRREGGFVKAQLYN